MRVFKLNITIHKWLSLFVGLQLLIWLGTGLYFNLMDHKKADGSEHRQSVSHQSETAFVTFKSMAELNTENVQQINLLWILGEPIYQVIKEASPHSYQRKVVELFNAVTGKPYKLDERLIHKIALASYKGNVQVSNVTLLNPPIAELPKEENAAWKVILNDANETNVYIDNSNGKVIAHINNDRRLRDFMFKLHFMDYANNGSFNNWFMIVFAIATLLLAITGITWLIKLYKRGIIIRIPKMNRLPK